MRQRRLQWLVYVRREAERGILMTIGNRNTRKETSWKTKENIERKSAEEYGETVGIEGRLAMD